MKQLCELRGAISGSNHRFEPEKHADRPAGSGDGSHLVATPASTRGSQRWRCRVGQARVRPLAKHNECTPLMRQSVGHQVVFLNLEKSFLESKMKTVTWLNSFIKLNITAHDGGGLRFL